MSRYIIRLLILSSLFLTACGEKETPVVVGNPSPKKVVSQNVTPTVFENSGITAMVQVNTGMTSTGGVKYETINGIEVPPEPDSEINNATLAGVDVNGNGVRDDVERIVAQVSENKDNYNVGIMEAKAYQKMVLSNISTRDEGLILYKATMCDGADLKGDIPKQLGGYYSTSIISITFNTEKRSDVLNHVNTLVGGFDGEEVACN